MLLNANVRAFFNYSVFASPGKGPYVETYLTISGNSVNFIKKDAGYVGNAEIIMIFKQGATIVKNLKYNLQSPSAADTVNKPNFIDLQRFYLPNGVYDFEIMVTDLNSKTKNRLNASDKITVNIQTDKIAISDIQLLDSYTKTVTNNQLSKSGYDLVPYSLNYYPDNFTKLNFYTEIYNTDTVLGAGSKYAVFYYVEDFATNEKVTSFYSFNKQNAGKVNVILSGFDLKNLKSGNYNLVVEAKDNKNNLLAQKKYYFQRRSDKDKPEAIASNAQPSSLTYFIEKINSKDTLKEMIRCVFPISGTTSKDWQNNQIANADENAMKQYLISFWLSKNKTNPEGEWLAYKKEVDYVNKTFKTGQVKGYDTDRGRVYLQYGPPDSRQEIPSEPDSYPYEIWQYYRIKDASNGQFQTNKKFVFYNPEIADNNYELLHSDARGEILDMRWQLKLKRRTQQKVNLDNTTPDSKYGNQSDDLFQNPR